jgi:hypothetical protein
LPQASKCWNYRCGSPHLALNFVFNLTIKEIWWLNPISFSLFNYIPIVFTMLPPVRNAFKGVVDGSEIFLKSGNQ